MYITHDTKTQFERGGVIVAEGKTSKVFGKKIYRHSEIDHLINQSLTDLPSKIVFDNGYGYCKEGGTTLSYELNSEGKIKSFSLSSSYEGHTISITHHGALRTRTTLGNTPDNVNAMENLYDQLCKMLERSGPDVRIHGFLRNLFSNEISSAFFLAKNTIKSNIIS